MIFKMKQGFLNLTPNTLKHINLYKLKSTIKNMGEGKPYTIGIDPTIIEEGDLYYAPQTFAFWPGTVVSKTEKTFNYETFGGKKESINFDKGSIPGVIVKERKGGGLEYHIGTDVPPGFIKALDNLP
jgi:hypothetical protein